MNSQTLKAQIQAKAAAYAQANTKAKKANFGLPVAEVGYTFATKAQVNELERQKETDFNNVHPNW